VNNRFFTHGVIEGGTELANMNCMKTCFRVGVLRSNRWSAFQFFYRNRRIVLACAVALAGVRWAAAQSGGNNKLEELVEAESPPRLSFSVAGRNLVLEYALQWQGSFTIFEIGDLGAPLETARPVHAGRSPYLHQGKFMLPKPSDSPVQSD